MYWDRIVHRLRQAIIMLYAAALLGSAALVIGPAYIDYTIEKDPGRALAEVVSVSKLRTSVDFQDEEGIFHSPPTGLLYPSGLGEGQRVWVEYAKSHPDWVKVAGRKWTLSVLPAISVAVAATVMSVLLWNLVNMVTKVKNKRSARCE